MKNSQKKKIKICHAAVTASAVIGYVFGILLYIAVGRLGIDLAKESEVARGLCSVLLWQACFFIVILVSGYTVHTAAICAPTLFLRGVLAGYSSTYLLAMRADMLYFMHTALGVTVMITMTSAAKAAWQKSGRELFTCVFFLLGIAQLTVAAFYFAMLIRI